MPPFGLYPIPRHHVYGSSPTTRPVFNSLEYENNEIKSSETANSAVSPLPSKQQEHTDIIGSGKKEKKKRNKGKQKLQRDAHESKDPQRLQAAFTISQNATTVAASGFEGKTDTTKKTKSAGNGADAIISVRKRKQATVDDAEIPFRSLAEPSKESFVIRGDMLQTLQASMSDSKSSFGYAHTHTQSSEKPSKKRQKANPKGMSELKKTSGEIKEGKAAIQKANNAQKQISERSSMVASPQTPPKAEVYTLSVKETPVPLPSNVYSLVRDRIEGHDRTPSKISTNLVHATETVQFSKLPQGLQTADCKKLEKLKKKSHSFRLSPSTPKGTEEPVSGLSSFEHARMVEIEPRLHTPLTSSSLVKYTQPLNDTPKLGSCSRAVAQNAGSTASSMSSLDFGDYYTRTNKPYSRSGAEIDPFVAPVVKENKHRERHEEADATTFAKRYYKAQRAINFSDESDYLHKYLNWHIENNSNSPLRCLGVATGCNSRQEQVLRQSKEGSSCLHKVLITADSELDVLKEAKLRSDAAESFLMTAVATKVPVPIGLVEGVWTLYCPGYSHFHVDKYGSGQRTLSIFSIAGLRDDHSYTARLSIPPRSMLYSVVSFSIPPHASFRTTTIKTSAEGYKIGLIFLGNGHLLLRVNLNLLLRGKPMETAQGKPMYMEFIGVHENATQWMEKEDELEVEGKKLFAKYDGDSE